MLYLKLKDFRWKINFPLAPPNEQDYLQVTKKNHLLEQLICQSSEKTIILLSFS